MVKGIVVTLLKNKEDIRGADVAMGVKNQLSDLQQGKNCYKNFTLKFL